MSSYECHEEHGKEPDYEAEHCETYYSCHDHHGSLEHCPHGHQFDFHDKECHEDKYVYCQEQRKSYSGHDSHRLGIHFMDDFNED
ncbi:hypothetical protein C0Q70_02312 [Pomacea canaliculata]|uniref:Chitin-binding type-2 domain-containing protein n=1 Tax=Pomacea canaliculata TaxID=400727 RepID=A0A2T7PPK2_POMCA|nr:hypothetical protein C0Q70_02312 [Pomacea canaliculata]